MAQPVNPRYKGKHFDPNFVARPRQPQPDDSAQDGQNPTPQVKKQPIRRRGPLPGPLPGPSNKQTNPTPTPLRDEPMFKDSIFGEEISVRENNMRTTIQPNLAAMIPTVNETWIQLSVDNANIGKEMLVEGLRYYSVGLTWLRMIQLKKANSQPMTPAEEEISTLCEHTNFAVPHSIFLYLQAIGNVKCTATGQQLIPTFPPLPTTVIEGRGGYYGTIDQNPHNHNLYEEIPALGVVVEGLQTALGNANPGPYDSVLRIRNLAVNQNLLGYVPLVNRRPEAKNFFLNIGITPQDFVENPANSGFNYDLMYAVSNWISTTSTFKVELVNFASMSSTGSQSQILMCLPQIQTNAAIVQNVAGEITATALMRDSKTTFGVAQYTLFQLYKEPATRHPEPVPPQPSMMARTWCCVNFTEIDPVPPEWMANRNERRNAPNEYTARRFESISQNNKNLRKRMISNMVISKR